MIRVLLCRFSSVTGRRFECSVLTRSGIIAVTDFCSEHCLLECGVMPDRFEHVHHFHQFMQLDSCVGVNSCGVGTDGPAGDGHPASYGIVYGMFTFTSHVASFPNTIF